MELPADQDRPAVLSSDRLPRRSTLIRQAAAGMSLVLCALLLGLDTGIDLGQHRVVAERTPMQSPFVSPVQVPPSAIRRLARQLARRIGSNWFGNRAGQNMVLFGAEFDASLEQAQKGLMSLERQVTNELATLGLEQLSTLSEQSDLTGDPLAKDLRGRVADHVARLPFWVRGVIGLPNASADYASWGKAPGLTATEAFLLSLGLNPLETFLQVFGGSVGGPAAEDPLTEALRMSHKVFARAVDPAGTNDIIDAAQILRALTFGGFEATVGFRAMLDKMVWRLHARQQPVSARSDDDVEITIEDASDPTAQPAPFRDATVLDRREFNTMARLVATLAMEHYGHDPTARKSDAPAQISGKATLHGFQISEKTVLKYLRHGAEQISGHPPPVGSASGNKQTSKRK